MPSCCFVMFPSLAMLLTLAIPQYYQGDPSYTITYIVAVVIVGLVVGVSLLAALRNPRMVRTSRKRSS